MTTTQPTASSLFPAAPVQTHNPHDYNGAPVAGDVAALDAIVISLPARKARKGAR